MWRWSNLLLDRCLNGILTPLIDDRVPPVPGSALAALLGARLSLPRCKVSLVCGPYQVGDPQGYVAEYLERPPTFTIKMSSIKVNVQGFSGSAIFNPFSWRTISPQLSIAEEGSVGCVRLREHTALPPGLEAGEAREPQNCLEYSRGAMSHDTLSIGPFKLVLPGQPEFRRIGLLKAAVSKGLEAAATTGSVTMVLEGREIVKLKIGTVNFKARILYINRFEEPETGVVEPLEANALTIKTPLGGIALASPDPLVISVKPGEIVVEASSIFKLALGGELEAFRLLAESLYHWKRVDVDPGKRVPGFWSVSAAAVVTLLTPREMEVKAVNPVSKPGIVSLQPPFMPRAASLETPYGSDEIVAGSEIRVPAPPCFCGLLRLKGSVFERLARRFSKRV